MPCRCHSKTRSRRETSQSGTGTEATSHKSLRLQPLQEAPAGRPSKDIAVILLPLAHLLTPMYGNPLVQATPGTCHVSPGTKLCNSPIQKPLPLTIYREKGGSWEGRPLLQRCRVGKRGQLAHFTDLEITSHSLCSFPRKSGS